MSIDVPCKTIISTYTIGADGRTICDEGWPTDYPETDTQYQWIRVQNHQPSDDREILSPLGLPPIVAQGLLAPETQPRLSKLAGGLLLVLRGVNKQARAEPDDMVSVRLWIEPRRVISVQLRWVLSVDEISEACAHGDAPATVSRFVFDLIEGMTTKIEAVVMMLVEQLDDFEEEELLGVGETGRAALSDLRRQLIVIRRYVAPQRVALEKISQTDTALLKDTERLMIREISDQTVRLVDDLDAARERAAVINDTWVASRAEEMNRNMLILSIVAAVFLPLGFLTGLLGVNVGGIPGVDSPYAFWIVCAASAGVATCLYAFFRWLKWM
ncbi:zinc transporter ZntB [Parvibaculaceae bacterium PLY_AMNH_Bact1]|nr:zinc transporter ZntB [Parvibaculaceae bacterium PLY_AMNH_Bact1]